MANCILRALCTVFSSWHWEAVTAAVSPRVKCVTVTLSVYSSPAIHIYVLLCVSLCMWDRLFRCWACAWQETHTHAPSHWQRQWSSTDVITQVHTGRNAIAAPRVKASGERHPVSPPHTYTQTSVCEPCCQTLSRTSSKAGQLIGFQCQLRFWRSSIIKTR